MTIEEIDRIIGILEDNKKILQETLEIIQALNEDMEEILNKKE